LSLALVFALLVSAPSQAQFVRRMVVHRAMGATIDAAFCQSDAARLCPGVADGSSQMQCLAQYKNQVSLPCRKELRKIEMRSGR